jgi:hypothetical protein
MKRILNLCALLETCNSDDLQKLFSSRMRNGERFSQICEAMLLPYNDTAKVIGWDWRAKKFGEPYRPQAPTTPKRVPAAPPPPSIEAGYGEI